MTNETNELILTLRIKEPFFTQIKEGAQKSELRSFTEYYINRICTIDKKTDQISGFKPLTHVLLINGYAKNSPRLKKLITGIFINEYHDNIPEGLMKGDLLFEIELE